MKKLYYKLSDNGDLQDYIIDAQAVMDYLTNDVDGVLKESDDEDYVLQITPIWLTEEEFENLPEYQF